MIPIIRGSKCTLRGFAWADFAGFAKMWADPAVGKFVPFAPLTAQECWPRINRNLYGWVERGYGQFCIADLDGNYIGVTGFFPNSIPKGEKGGDFEVMAGWMLSEHAHGLGIGTQAAMLVHEWLDRERPGTKVICGMHSDNIGSIRVAERCGYQLLVRVVDQDGPGQLMVREAT